MAKTYLTTNNSRGNEVTANRPSFVHIRGYNAGVYVRVNKEGTAFNIYATRGSNDPTLVLIGYLFLEEGNISFELEERNVDRDCIVAI